MPGPPRPRGSSTPEQLSRIVASLGGQGEQRATADLYGHSAVSTTASHGTHAANRQGRDGRRGRGDQGVGSIGTPEKSIRFTALRGMAVMRSAGAEKPM